MFIVVDMLYIDSINMHPCTHISACMYTYVGAYMTVYILSLNYLILIKLTIH